MISSLSVSSCSPRVTRGTPPAARRSARLDLRPGLGDITAPVLLVTAESDASIPPETVVPLAAEIPGAHLEILPDAAHLVSYSHPEVINSLLLTHLT